MDRNPVSLLRAVLSVAGGVPRSKAGKEEPEMRSGLKPWIPPRQLEESKREARRTAPKTAEHFIPRMSYDTMFAALRHVIFKIDRKSATPIAHIIYDACSDAELSELASGVCPIGGRDSYLYELWWQQSESKKLKHPLYARLRAKIEEAREHHSRQLREHGYEDVDITYWSGEANYTFMKADEVEIKKSGGKLYHIYPYDQETRVIAISALVRSDVLAKLFPAERVERGYNFIETNTPQAPSEPAPDRSADDNVQQNEDDSKTRKDSRNDAANEQKQPQENIDSSVKNVCGTIIPDEYGKDKVKMPTYLQSIWSPNNVPFSNIDVWTQETFWSVDLPVRQKMLRDWRNEVAEWQRLNPGAQPNEPVAKSGFPLAAEMSGVYPPSRNATWYDQNVRQEELKENMLAQRLADQAHRNARDRARRNEYILARNKANTKATKTRHNMHSQVLIKNVMSNQIIADQQVQESMARSMQLREATGMMPAGWDKGLEDKREMPVVPDPPSPPKSPDPKEESQEGDAETQGEGAEHTDKPAITFAQSLRPVWLEKPLVPSSHIPNQDLTEPFPKYEDPMAKDNRELEQSKATLLSQLRDEAMIRKATKTSVADILAATGVCRDCSGSVVIMPDEYVDEDEGGEEEPGTPRDPPVEFGERKASVKVVSFEDEMPRDVENEVN